MKFKENRMNFESLPVSCKNCCCSSDGIRCSYFGRDIKSQGEALTCREYEARIQDRANRVMAEFTGTNFNALAWDAPKLENGDYGYLPNHEKYLLITAWLNTKLETIWTVDEENAVTKRLRGVYDTGRYDVKVRYDKKTEAVDWHFVKDYVFEVNYEHDIHWR